MLRWCADASLGAPIEAKRNPPMPLSWNEIKDRALAFSRDWAGESREHAEDHIFRGGLFRGKLRSQASRAANC